MNPKRIVQTLITIVLFLFAAVSAGCGTFQLAPANEGSEPPVEATSAGEMASAETAPGEQPAAAAMQEATAEPANPPAAQPPQGDAFSDPAAAAWGEAFCPSGISICIRPYALESSSTEQMLHVEVWGAGDPVHPRGLNLDLNWEGETANGDVVKGDACANSYELAPDYQAGTGHFSRICFASEDAITQVILNLRAQGMSPAIRFPVGENGQPVGGWNHLSSAATMPIGEPFVIGAATLTINSVEDLGDSILLDVSIQAPADSKLLVKTPEWIVIGDALEFYTVDAQGNRAGWQEGQMRAYEVVGGGIERGEGMNGKVVLQKVSPEWGLLLTYGSHANGSADDAAILIPASGS